MNIPINIQKENLSRDNLEMADKNYKGTTMVEYLFLKLVHRHYKEVACIKNFRVYLDMSGSSGSGPEDYEIIDYDDNKIDNKIFASTVQECKRDMMIIYVFVNYGIGFHSNMIIINKRMNTIEYYDPHGLFPLVNAPNSIMLGILLELKVTRLAIDLDMIVDFAALNCPLQNDYVVNNEIRDIGYCTIFTSIFMLFRLSNHLKELSDFSKEFYTYFKDLDVNEYARHFSYYLVNEIHKMAKTFGIHESDLLEITREYIKTGSMNDLILSIDKIGGNPLLLVLRGASLLSKGSKVSKAKKLKFSADVIGSYIQKKERKRCLLQIG